MSEPNRRLARTFARRRITTAVTKPMPTPKRTTTTSRSIVHSCNEKGSVESTHSQSVSQLFHGPAPRSPLHRLAVRLRHSRSNTSTEYSLPGATQLSQVHTRYRRPGIQPLHTKHCHAAVVSHGGLTDRIHNTPTRRRSHKHKTFTPRTHHTRFQHRSHEASTPRLSYR